MDFWFVDFKLFSILNKKNPPPFQKPQRSPGNVTSRLQPDQMNVLKNSLGKKPKNKYRRADTSPGLFNQNIAIAQNQELDEIFEPIAKNLNQVAAKSQMNLVSKTMSSETTVTYQNTHTELEEVKKARPKGASSRRPPTRWKGSGK